MSQSREKILVVLGLPVRNGFAIGLHDLEILVINPDLTLKITLVLLDCFRRDVEDIAIDLVDHFLSEILHAVFPDIIACENKRLDLSHILEIFWSKDD